MEITKDTPKDDQIDMTDIVERLRANACPENSGCNTMPSCACGLQNDAADTIKAQAAEIEWYRQALRIIAGEQQCIDNLMGNVDIARAALGKDKP